MTRGCLGPDLAGEALATMAIGSGLLTVTTVCGQTGIRDDLTAIARLAGRTPGLKIHADATQAAAWEPVAFAESPFSTLAFAPHKFGGPRGIGGLLIRSGVALQPLVPGPQELGLRGGTEAVALAVGFAQAGSEPVISNSNPSPPEGSMLPVVVMPGLVPGPKMPVPPTVPAKDPVPPSREPAASVTSPRTEPLTTSVPAETVVPPV